MNEEKLFHIGLTREQGAKYAILPGDPGRVPLIAAYLDDAQPLAANREFTSWCGTLYGERVIVMSTGIGGPSAAIALEELCQAGLQTAIRSGTCGGIQEEVVPGDIIVPTAAVRMEGTSKEYAPLEFPAAADFRVVKALVGAAEQNGFRVHTGIVQSKDSFYGQHDPEQMPVSYKLKHKWEAWKRLGVLASEMESAALFTVAAARHVRVGCVLHALWNQERKRKGYEDRDDFDVSAAIKTAVDAMKRLILEDHPERAGSAPVHVSDSTAVMETQENTPAVPAVPKKKKLVAIVGPTASGKTALAIKLAKKYNGEVVSADSMQIYKGMEIASAKPTEEEMQGIPHHLMGFLDPSETFSVSDFVRLATEVIEDILDRGKLPIVCGGAGLYIRSLLDNVTFTAEEPDEALRKELRARYEAEGGEALLTELASFDPETAAKLSPKDGKRIVRAIEIYRTTGITMSEQISLSKLTPSPYDVTVIGLTFADRQNLYDRINRRVDEMLVRGLLPEADKFYSTEKSVTSSAAIGYKELKPYLDGKITLEAATEKLKMESRRYAKRQITWFKRDTYIHWIEVDRCEDVAAQAEAILDGNVAAAADE